MIATLQPDVGFHYYLVHLSLALGALTDLTWYSSVNILH